MTTTSSSLDPALSGHLTPLGVEGLYARSRDFEAVITALERSIGRVARGDGAEIIRFPPAMSRAHFERSGYMKNFPQLAGSVHAFAGGDREHAALLAKLASGEDWTSGLAATGLVLTPAACYPLYPLLAARGPLQPDGALFDISGWCHRHEPSPDPMRQQMFRMREFVRAGDVAQVGAFRHLWVERGRALMARLALPHDLAVANDPFFGRAGGVMAQSQREQDLKLELRVARFPTDEPATACLSFNHHLDHFGRTWGIVTHAGAVAQTACVGFGLERLAIALFRHHGGEPQDWPAPVREALFEA